VPVRVALELTSEALTLAPATAAPVESTTLPARALDVPLCPNAGCRTTVNNRSKGAKIQTALDLILRYT